MPVNHTRNLLEAEQKYRPFSVMNELPIHTVHIYYNQALHVTLLSTDSMLALGKHLVRAEPFVYVLQDTGKSYFIQHLSIAVCQCKVCKLIHIFNTAYLISMIH